jgi:heme/copper-type cytochrome/quinol oxidase subunit 2
VSALELFLWFSDDSWFFFLIIILFIFFVLVFIVLRVLRRQGQVRVEPKGNLLRDARGHDDLLKMFSDGC